MSWLGDWFQDWFGRWFGQHYQIPPVPYTRYGRVFDESTDRLFGYQQSSALCQVSSGAVILGRQETDDYVRFRVPDTDCPELPQRNEPLDAGGSDFAEPSRWIFTGRYRPESNGWWFGPNPDDNLNFVRPSYTCYEGDFVCYIRCSWGGPFGPFVTDFFGLFLPDIGCGIGFGNMLVPDESGLPTTFAAFQQNGLWQSWAGLYTKIHAGRPVWLFLSRFGTTIYGGFSRLGPDAPELQRELAYGVSGQVWLAVGKDYRHGDNPFYPYRPLAVAMSQWRTLLGAPSEIWVQTPVVDLGRPMRVIPRVRPFADRLQWRASNSPFNPGDDTPSWNNPRGEYRYWQVHATNTSASISWLIERIELTLPVVLSGTIYGSTSVSATLNARYASRGSTGGNTGVSGDISVGPAYTCEIWLDSWTNFNTPYDYRHQFISNVGMEVPLYVIGWAYDGDVAKSVYVSNIDEAYEAFGGVLTHDIPLSAGATSFSVPLKISPVGWTISVVSGGFALRNVVVSGNTVRFGAVPSSGVVRFRYHPAPPSDNHTAYLPSLLRAAFLLGCRHVVGVRVPGGAVASASAAGWTVMARREGVLYNGTVVQFLPDRLEVSVPYRSKRTYPRQSDMMSMFSRIEEVSVIPPSHPSWPGLTLTLSGGYSANYNPASLLALANLWTPELPGVVLVPGMGLCDVLKYVAEAFVSMMQSARCMVVFGTSVMHVPYITG